MSFKSLVRELRDGIGSMSRRGGGAMEGMMTAHSRGCAPHPQELEEQQQQGRWANLPPELLLDVIQRVEASEVAWPERRHVLACAAVCRSWRNITKEVVRSPEQCGQITFPFPLKQPGPRDHPIQCFIRRESDVDLLLVPGSDPLSNFLATKFTVYDSEPPFDAAVSSSNRSNRRIHSRQVSSRVPAGNYNIATISYELNILRTRGPRRMQCMMHSIPISSIQEGGSVPAPSSFIHSVDQRLSSLPVVKGKEPVIGFSSTSLNESNAPVQINVESLILKNKAPRWHEQLQCWCLNFRG
ncbi:unnamed protein product [Musa acuminata subsp. malaccensis]|uniref:(wild Malaysian banana) hypothetical protein n=1 Tax=Musa acuminata subsp. malaccensis TaxID=214687 RepID=A0A804I6Q8_MUSAM|nr:unnamed protein product [Musa acuminata subsp. malaccensis]